MSLDNKKRISFQKEPKQYKLCDVPSTTHGVLHYEEYHII